MKTSSAEAGPAGAAPLSAGVKLIWIIGLSLTIFFADCHVPLGAGIGVAYIAAVLASLWSPRAQDTWAAAGLTTILTLARLFIGPEVSDGWFALGDRALAIFAIWTVAVLGLWQKRSIRAQSVAQAEAAQAQKTNAALRAALVRTEAAESQLRRGQRLIATVAEMARIGGWELDLATMTPIWTSEVYRIHEIDPSTPVDLQSAIEFYAPEARPIIESTIRDAIEHGKSFDITVPLITTTGRRRWVRSIGVPERTNGVTTRLSGAFQDVTESHETQMRLARASRSSSEGHWDYDFGTEKVWCSATYQELLGLEPKDTYISAEQFRLQTHPEDQSRISAAFEQHITDGSPYDVQQRIQVASGEWRWYRTRGSVERDDLGRLVSFAGSLIDIHEDRLAQEELRLVRTRYERAIHGTQDGLWEWDIGVNRMWLSPRYRDLLGFEPGELPEEPEALAQVLMHPEDIPRFREATRAHVEGTAPYDVEIRLRTRAGVYKWFRIRGSLERDEQGRPYTLAGSSQDITQRKAAEAAREEAEQRLARAIRGSSDGFFEADRSSGDAGRVWYSPRVREMLGYGPDEPFPGSIRELMTPEDRERVEIATRRHFENDEPYDVIYQLPTRTGEWRWFRARGLCERDANGTARHFSGSIQDITPQREAEAALVAAKEAAAAANRAKSEFLANMSHEIRTPMNGVLGMTELLLDTPLEPLQREFAETIRSSATSLLGILNDLLDFSKIEAGRLEIESVEMNVRECVEEIGTMMAVHAAAKNLEFIVNVDPATPERVIGDPHRLRQILNNLIGNAIKFTREGEVVVEVFSVAGTGDRTLLHFEVRDSGTGMSQDILGRLFQPFVQADASTTRHYGGTGLGLSIVKRLVELMGGQVSVVSAPGKGSTFSFTLPCKLADGESPVSTVQVSTHGKRVLVVDDNETNRRVLCGQLKPAGYTLATAATADEAITRLTEAAAKHEPFDVVIADDQMPGCDGATLAASIKAVPNLMNTQLIMLTSLDRHGNVQRLADLGFAGYLTKPVRGRELRACIERVLELDSAGASGTYPRLVTRGTLRSDKSQGRYHGRILVVEDNVVNQQVTRRFLERLGCEVEIADNGERAIASCAKSTYELILMDVQMPVMDGLTATREIRRQAAPGHRTPIIALTASAMTDELERCLAAGMDELLTKPLEPTRLRETLERYGLRGSGSEATKLPALPLPARSSGPPIDLQRLQAVVGDDSEFVHELCKTFIASSARIMEDLRGALSSNDRALVSAMAHKLKGGSSSVCALHVGELAAALETKARSTSFPELQVAVDELDAAIAECTGFIEAEVA